MKHFQGVSLENTSCLQILMADQYGVIPKDTVGLETVSSGRYIAELKAISSGRYIAELKAVSSGRYAESMVILILFFSNQAFSSHFCYHDGI